MCCSVSWPRSGHTDDEQVSISEGGAGTLESRIQAFGTGFEHAACPNMGFSAFTIIVETDLRFEPCL